MNKTKPCSHGVDILGGAIGNKHMCKNFKCWTCSEEVLEKTSQAEGLDTDGDAVLYCQHAHGRSP